MTLRKTDSELPENLRHDADAGPVIMPSYTVLKREDWERLVSLALEERDFRIAWDRRAKGESEGASLDELAEKYGL